MFTQLLTFFLIKMSLFSHSKFKGFHRKKIVFPLKMTGYHAKKFQDDRQSYVAGGAKDEPSYWVTFLNGRQRILLFTDDLAVATNASEVGLILLRFLSFFFIFSFCFLRRFLNDD